MSPSLDPIGAVKAVAQGEERPTLVAALSFAWQEVMRDALAGGSHFPRIGGLAVFAGIFEADRSFMLAVNRPTIDRIVLGSPIYVRELG